MTVIKSRSKEFQGNFTLMTLQITRKRSQEAKVMKKKSDKK